jgi:hypothetical protein
VAKKNKMGDGEQSFDSGIKGRSRGTPGIEPAFNSPIENDVFSKDWATAMNANLVHDPMVDPRVGGAFEPEKLGLPGNPLGIGGADLTGKRASKNIPNSEAKEIETRNDTR